MNDSVLEPVYGTSAHSCDDTPASSKQLYGALAMCNFLGVTSSPGVIPLAADNGMDAEPGVGRRTIDDRRAVARRRSERLLLAEDNQVNALLATRQFDRFGFTLTVVSDGKEAVKVLQQQPFDLVFMDCHTPEMDGFEATK